MQMLEANDAGERFKLLDPEDFASWG